MIPAAEISFRQHSASIIETLEKKRSLDVEATPHRANASQHGLEVHENNPSTEPDPQRLVTTLLFKLAD